MPEKKYNLNEEEARAIVAVLGKNWVQPELQKVVYELVFRLEKELARDSM